MVPTIRRSPEYTGTGTRNDVEPNAEANAGRQPAGPADGESDWSWPPYAPVPPAEDPRFVLDAWAPPSSVRRPWLRLGRWTILYRRAARADS